MTSDDLCEVTITAPEAEWLIDLCRTLIEQGLAASAHVIHPVTSIYRWQGAINQTTEARAFLRSRRALVAEVVAFVTERHPYEVPNITAVPFVGGNPAYLTWVAGQTAKSAPQ